MKTKISRYDVMTIKLVGTDEILMFKEVLQAGQRHLKETLTGNMRPDALYMTDKIISDINNHFLIPNMSLDRGTLEQTST
ncbi:MAG: hypothetical protein H8E17_14550 [Deltaproteobacteria bacterium]|nr:hypothetical protein [Deltaproteobacteria bacterium]